jgi:hypothetical protein
MAPASLNASLRSRRENNARRKTYGGSCIDLRLLRAVAVTDSLERGPNLANQPGSRGMPAKRGKLHRLR